MYQIFNSPQQGTHGQPKKNIKILQIENSLIPEFVFYGDDIAAVIAEDEITASEAIRKIKSTI